jgi:hypothetical protein
LTDTLQRVLEAGEEQVRVGDAVEALQSRGFGPSILASALPVLLPTGGVPGVYSLVAVLIVPVAVQRLRAFGIERTRFRRGVARLRPYTKRVDRYTDARLAWLTDDTGTRLSAAFCLVLAVSMPPLERVPFAAALPASAIALGSAEKMPSVAFFSSPRRGTRPRRGILPRTGSAEQSASHVRTRPGGQRRPAGGNRLPRCAGGGLAADHAAAVAGRHRHPLADVTSDLSHPCRYGAGIVASATSY